MSVDAVSESAEQIAVGLPSLNLDLLFDGLEGISPLLATAIPLGIYNFTEAMSNVESAAAAGDSYEPAQRPARRRHRRDRRLRRSAARSRPPSTSGTRAGRPPAGASPTRWRPASLIFLLCTFGLFPLLGALLPVPAIVPVLLYIGLVIGAQAFRAVPKAHYAAIVLAIVPNVAAWATGLIDNALAAAGTSAAEVGFGDARAAPASSTTGLLDARRGRRARGHGARRDRGVHDRPALPAGRPGYAFFGAALAAIGLIHGEKVEFFADLEIALGYAFLGARLPRASRRCKVPEREVDPDRPGRRRGRGRGARPARAGGRRATAAGPARARPA